MSRMVSRCAPCPVEDGYDRSCRAHGPQRVLAQAKCILRSSKLAQDTSLVAFIIGLLWLHFMASHADCETEECNAVQEEGCQLESQVSMMPDVLKPGQDLHVQVCDDLITITAGH